jgi:hypothetical protein
MRAQRNAHWLQVDCCTAEVGKLQMSKDDNEVHGSGLPKPHQPREIAQSMPRAQMPTPLYVTQNGKGVLLRFKTQAEADAAWRMLAALAEAHADRTHVEQTEKQLECEHAYEALDDKCFVCTKCGHFT